MQTFRLAEANKASRDATALHLVAVQERAAEAMLLVSYLQAKSQGDSSAGEVLPRPLPPRDEAGRRGLAESDPFNNPAAPYSPFKMAE